MKGRATKKRRKLWILGFLALFTLLLLLSAGKRGFIQQYRVWRMIKQRHKKIQAIQEEKKRLEEEEKKLDDPEHIEKLAREYGMAKEKEKIYRVVPKEKD